MFKEIANRSNIYFLYNNIHVSIYFLLLKRFYFSYLLLLSFLFNGNYELKTNLNVRKLI